MVKNHISGWGKDLEKAVEDKFGVSTQTIIRAALGDSSAQTNITDMGLEGEKLQANLPEIKRHLMNHFNGTTQLNTVLAETLTQGGKDAQTLKKLESSTDQNNTKYLNAIREIQTKYLIDVEKEEFRHSSAIEKVTLQAWIDQNARQVDYDADISRIQNAPALNQISENRRFEAEKSKHILTHGSDSRLDLLPRKQYITDGFSAAWNKVRELFS